LTLAYLDECGFSPSQPVNYSWTAAGTRKALPYENPQGRRVNALAVLLADGPTPSLWWDRVPRTLTSPDLLAILPAIPNPTGRLVVVMDNGSLHVSRMVKDALPSLKAQGIELYYLPPYSPELNDIERVFGGIKHHGLPKRRYPTVPDLLDAVDQAFTEAEVRLLARHQSLHQLSPAA
jgi:putative transposase